MPTKTTVKKKTSLKQHKEKEKNGTKRNKY